MGRTPSSHFSPLALGVQIRRDFALHYAGEAMAALGDLLSRLEGRGRAADSIPSEDLLALLDEVTRIKGPYIHALPIPRMGALWTTFATGAGLHPAIVETFAGLGFRRLYTHQEVSIRAILSGSNTLLSAATGRGKTEGWLIPILQRIVEDHDVRLGGRASPGIVALLMYPTKALAQDQLKRLLRYLFFLNRRLAGDGIAPVTVGIWDGDTPRRAADNEDYYLSKTMELIPCPLHGPDCQHLKLGYLPDGRPIPAIRYPKGHEDVAFDFVYLTKDDILAEPVDILLTNPDTINWRLINVNALDELQLFVQQPRFVVFDEVHLYSSLFGSFVSTLMKRYLRTRIALWERWGVDRAAVERDIQFIAASATVANKVDLFRQICPLIGEPTIVEEQPRHMDGDWPETVPSVWSDGFLDESGIVALAREVAPQAMSAAGQGATPEHAYEAIASTVDDPDAVPLKILGALHTTLRRQPMTVEQAVALLQDRYPDLSDEEAELVLDNFFVVGQGTGFLEDRAHLFSWPLEGLYACLECGRVHPAPTHVCANPECGGRFVTQITVCRDCGQPSLEGWFCPACRQVHPFHLTVGGERAVQEWVCPVCETEGSRLVWQPRYRCPECGWTGNDPGGPRLACPRCAASLAAVGYHPELNAVDLPIVCRREGCGAVHVGKVPERCTCGERILYYDALFDLSAVDRCGSCRQLRERLPGAPCAREGHVSRRVPHSLSSYVVVRPGRHEVRQLREANGKAGCCSDGTPLKHRRFLSLTRSPDHLAVTLSQYLLRRIVKAGGQDLDAALCRAKLMAFSDSIRDMESLGRDFNEPEESLGLQSVMVRVLEASGGALTLAELHRQIVTWQEGGPTFATWVTDTYWGRRAIANELIPGQYRAIPALPRHGIVDVRLRADLAALSDEARELLAELASNNHQRQDTLRRQPAFDRGLPFLERRGLIARYVDDERGQVFVYLNPAQIEVTLVGPGRPIAYDPERKRFVTALARQLGLVRGGGGDDEDGRPHRWADFDVPWRKRVDLERRDVFSQLAFRLGSLPQPMRLVGQVYRGATDKVERRKLEADFRGSPRPNFLSTGPAMEVGIDIGDLNALLLFGTPPNINAYLQRVGRAGRSEKRSLVTSVSRTNPIDFYYYERPGELIASRPEPVPLNEHNEQVLRTSLTWALQDWVAAHFWVPWRRHQMRDADGQLRTVVQAEGAELRIDEHPNRPVDIYRWSSVYHRPAQQIDLGGALAPLSWLVGPDSLYAPEPRRWLESILAYRFCAQCGAKFPADADVVCHGERPPLASEVFSSLIDDAIAGFEGRLLAFLYLDAEAIAAKIDALSRQLQQMGRRPSPFARRRAADCDPQQAAVDRDPRQAAADPTAVFRRSEVERAMERAINYKQRLEGGRFAEAHASSVEAKYAYSLRGGGDTAEVITWRPGGEDVLMREAREMAMVMIDHHPYGVFVQGNRTYVSSRIEWESLPDLWQRKDLGDVGLGPCLCGGGEVDGQGVCPACGTRYVGIRKVHLYPHTARLAALPGHDRRAQPRDVHWRPTGVDASNSHAETVARILPGGFRPRAGSAFELLNDGVSVGELAYGDLDLVVLSRQYVAYYEDGGMDPLPRPYELCGECGGVLVPDRLRLPKGGTPAHCLFDSGHDLSQKVRVGLVNVLRTQGLRLATDQGLSLTHSLVHGLRLALQKIAGVDIRSIGEVVAEEAVHLYDTEPGGSGVCQLLVAQDEEGQYANLSEAMRVIEERVTRCDCEVACPKCLMQYGCAVKNSLKTLSRAQVVEWMAGALDLRALQHQARPSGSG